jgi:hypothetical protein
MSTLPNPLITSARAEFSKKVYETGGTNRGPDVEKYQKSVGLSPGSPWCAAFVAWNVMNSRSLEKAPTWCSGSVVTMWQKATKKLPPGSYTTPKKISFQTSVKPGWIWCRAKDAAGASQALAGIWTQGHTGIVISVDDKGFTTIEGNTNAAGSREGDGVYEKRHLWSDSKQMTRTIGWFDPSAVPS